MKYYSNLGEEKILVIRAMTRKTKTKTKPVQSKGYILRLNTEVISSCSIKGYFKQSLIGRKLLEL